MNSCGRNCVANGRKAYDTALRFFAKTPLTDEEAEEIRGMVTRLKLALADWGKSCELSAVNGSWF